MGVTVSLPSATIPDKWPDWAKDPGARTLPPVIYTWWPHSWSRFLPWAEYAQNFSVKTPPDWLPSNAYSSPPPFFCGQRALGGSRSGLLVPSERGWDSAHIHLQRAVGGIRPSQISVTPIPQHSSQGIRCGCPPENCASANRAEAESPLHWSVPHPEAD